MNIENLKMTPRPERFNVFAKICPCCQEKFTPRNRKRIFCTDYCKHVWHYEADKLEHANDKLLADGNKFNYRVLKDFDKMGMHVVTTRDLIIKGFNELITPPYGMVGDKMCALYNCFALLTEGDNFKIIKISPWRLSK